MREYSERYLPARERSEMKQKIRALLADRAALLAAVILIGVVAFCGYMGMWIKTNIG